MRPAVAAVVFAWCSLAFAKHVPPKKAPVKAPEPVRAAEPAVRAQPRPGQAPEARRPAPDVKRPEPNVVQRESKIEFDERLVQGQTAQGAIYLFQRGESEFRSMVHVPSSFRERTLEKIYAGQNETERVK